MAVPDSDAAPVAVRDDITAVHQNIWRRLGEPGTWWTGAERVAIAAEVRHAPACTLCAERKAALSPFAIDGAHDSLGVLPAPAIDVIHRVRTDPGRLTRAWYEGVLAGGLSDSEYVEITIVLALTVTVDTFARSIGAAPWPLPAPVAGAPNRRRPDGLADEGAYVPTIAAGAAGAPDADLYNDRPAPNIYRSISLVPDQARLFYDVIEAQYLPSSLVLKTEDNGGRAISRPQIELIAARVSSLNGCFF